MRRQKVDFEPIVPGHIGMYVCGPTTYAPAHIGHAYSAIAFDTIRRSLEFLGWSVKYVRNVTDIDDKIIKRANETGVDPFEMSAGFARDYNRDMAAFGVRPPDIEPKVTGHISEIITLISRLIAAGKAYSVHRSAPPSGGAAVGEQVSAGGGDVYYEVDTFPAYGKLSGMTLDQLREGARVEVDDRKRSAPDFALWKSAKPGEPSWDSPWGKGRPGWHIECSAMTIAHLGTTFDLHAGGKDLIFPHHENEIAQSQGADGEGTFAHYWLHNGFLNFEGIKMSKSLGNVFDCEQITAAVGGEALRFFCVSHHYRSPVDFEVEQVADGVRFHSLEAADRRLAYFYETLRRIDDFIGTSDGGTVAAGEVNPGADLPAKARDALADDFNTPQVVAEMGFAAATANKLLDNAGGMEKNRRRRVIANIGRGLRSVGEAIGVLAATPAVYLAARRARLVAAKHIDVAGVETRIADRKAARAAKDFARADALRGELTAMGVELLDTPAGTDWRVIEARAGSD